MRVEEGRRVVLVEDGHGEGAGVRGGQARGGGRASALGRVLLEAADRLEGRPARLHFVYVYLPFLHGGLSEHKTRHTAIVLLLVLVINR